MHQLPEHGLTSSASFDARENGFLDWIDQEGDPSRALASLIVRLGANLKRIMDEGEVDAALSSLVDGSPDWTKAVEAADFYRDTALGKKLYRLTAYAVFGLTGPGFPSEDEVRSTLESVEALLTDCLPDQWLSDAENVPLLPIVVMARARLNLDNGFGLDPEGLALLGGVKLSRIRNMMSGSAPELPKDPTGLLSNAAARAWLENRETFLHTITKQGAAEGAADIEPIFIPVARDGTMFTPDQQRNGSYQIGEKGAEEYVSSYEVALARLQAMPVARWRRPNEHGNWGIVSAIEWRRVDRNSI
jgi:hypothetical protein|tara:strand:+ start:11101 stop:12009 length:909 start_codon:yes stop_codon:yes gene_type:complete